MPEFDTSLVWFRRDLRLFDHAALHHALSKSQTVFCAFIFDKAILHGLPAEDRRINFIHASLRELDCELRKIGSALIVLHDDAVSAIPQLASELGAQAVFVNRDYEPDANARDAEVERLLQTQGRQLISFKDQLIFEESEILSLAGKPFSVFTPYKKAWLKKLLPEPGRHVDDLMPYPVEPYAQRFAKLPFPVNVHFPTLDEMGFNAAKLIDIAAGMSGAEKALDVFIDRIAQYSRDRDFPAIEGTSRLSVHLRFGTVSIRAVVGRAITIVQTEAGSADSAATWLSELIWREFFSMILHHYPQVATHAFKSAYDHIIWERGEHADTLFQAWCCGQTGYPLVDAAMRQLNQTGYMHNRLRMIAASFLVKDLGIDWRWGERYFAEKLLDFDLASNNGGWQWVASSGCDAQPYFRIFNPVMQSQKFDPDGKFIRRYLPALSKLNAKEIHAPWLLAPSRLTEAGICLGQDYPAPLIDHAQARHRTLERYAIVKSRNQPALSK